MSFEINNSNELVKSSEGSKKIEDFTNHLSNASRDILASNEALKANGFLSEREIFSAAEELLGINLSSKQQELLMQAYNVPQGDNIQKGKILMGKGGFDRNQAQILIDQGIAGNPHIFESIPGLNNISDLIEGFPVSDRIVSVLSMLGENQSIIVDIRGTTVRMNIDNCHEIFSQHSDSLMNLNIKRVVSEGEIPIDFTSSKIPDNWLQERRVGIEEGIQKEIESFTDIFRKISPDKYEEFEINPNAFFETPIDVLVHMDSGDITTFSGTPEMIMELTKREGVSQITNGFNNMDTWLPSLHTYDYSRSSLNRADTLAEFNRRIPESSRYMSHESDLLEMPFYHGTVSTMEDSVKTGPRNVGKGFGGSGLYIAIGEDRHIAEAYANMARHGQGARQKQAGIESAEVGTEVVLEGKINPEKQLRVGTFTIVRDGKIDLENGILPAMWANDPRLQELMIEQFDILDIRGARSAGMNLDTDRILIFHESAGADAIIWN